MRTKLQILLPLSIVVALLFATAGTATLANVSLTQMSASQAASAAASIARDEAAQSLAQPVVAKKAPIAIGALRSTGEHLIAPRDEIVIEQLRNGGMLPLNATPTQIQTALQDFKAKFAKQSDTWISPEIQAKALARESQLANPKLPLSTLAIQPVTATVMAMAVDFSATDVFTIPVADVNGNCITQTVTITGPLNGSVPHPGPRDNNTVWYSPTLTANAKFYEKLVFGYEGIGRTRYDLTDPIDGQPGINLAGYTVQDYYDHVAGDGNVYITGTIEGWVTVPHSEGYYGADNCASGNHGGGAGVPVAQLVIDAATQFSQTYPSYYNDVSAGAFWPKYDADHDGVVDTFWVVHGGMGQEAGGGAQGDFSIWSHSSDLRYYNQWPAGYQVYQGDPLTTTDDIYIGPYTMQPENLDLGVLAEEFGHNFFGFPDMYTTDADNSIGFWNIMAGGAWGGYLGGSVPTGMPLWFRMIAWCGTGYCNWQEPMVTRSYTDPGADVVIGQLEKTPAGVNKGVRINLPPVVEDLPNYAGTGKGVYSGTGRDGVDLTLSQQINVGATATGTLTMDAYWSIEQDWDYGYVMVNGTILSDTTGIFVNSNPNGTNIGYGLTGDGSGALSFDLSAYQGQTITLTLRYRTDTGTTLPGWWIDNVRLDGNVVDAFESAVAPDTFPGWTNSNPGWFVVPTTNSYTNYYLVEWRSDTKYDKMVKTSYVTSYSDEDEWEVARVPYNIPGALVYYRNTKYTSTYALAPNQYDPPAFGPKYQLLVVDMNPSPLRIGRAAPYTSVLGTRNGSYDAALTLQPSEAFTLTEISSTPTNITGTFVFAPKSPVTNFNDAKGYYAGFYYGSPCAVGSVCYTNRWGSAAVPARGNYSTRITNYNGAPFYGLYGATIGGFPLGSGNPGDDNVQHGVNIDLLAKATDNTTATLRLRNYSVDIVTSTSDTIQTSTSAYTITYQTVVHNLSAQASNPVLVTYSPASTLKVVSLTASPNVGTVDLATPNWTIPWLAPNQTVTLTLVATGTATGPGYIETDVNAWDGQINRGPWFLYTDILFNAPTSVAVTGPTNGNVNTGYDFTAQVSPITATQPITYIWQATGQSNVVHTGRGINDTATFTWTTLGAKTITVTANNGGGSVMSTTKVFVSSPDYAAISILHTNDFHGQLEASGSNPGYARDVAVVNQVRNELFPANVLLLDAGDEMQGSLLSNLNKGAPVIDLFNYAGVKAATFGNHEFDWGQQTLISRTQEAAYPYVTANIVVSDTGSCTNAGWTAPGFAKPWITTTLGTPGNEVVVGIVGVTTLEVPQITVASATAGLCFKDPAQSISHYVPAMKAAGAQVIVVLSHLGYPDGGYGYGVPVYGDQTLAKKLVEANTPANLIIGGHSHTNLAAATVISGTPIVQAYYNGRNVGRADVLVNRTTGAVTVTWQRIAVSTSGPEDAGAKAKIAVWATDPVYVAKVNTPIGYTKVDLLRNTKIDNMMGTFIDDAIYNALNNDVDPNNNIDMFFNNAGGIRTDWCRIPDPANPGQYKWSSTSTDCHTGVYTDTPMLLNYGNMFTILPFGNQTIVGKMTGAQIMDVVNFGPTVANGVIQPAGLKYTYYAYTDTLPGPQPYAWGAYNITVRNKTTGVYEPLVMTRTYLVGSNEFLAPGGGDGYNGFKYMTDYTYYGDMLNAVDDWVSAIYTQTNPYMGPNGDGALDGRITRNGTNTYGGTATEVVPVTILAHNDSHGRLLPTATAPGYTNLVTLIRQEQAHNATRTLLLQGGDNIQGDAMDAFYKAAFTGKGSDGTTLPVSLTVNPVMAAFNAMNYDAMTLGNHEYNFGSAIFVGTLGQATFPLLQANVYDAPQPYRIYLPLIMRSGTGTQLNSSSTTVAAARPGIYGLDQVNVRPYITKTLPGSAGNGNIDVAVLGIGNHRIPQYELPSNIPGLTFTNPITEAQNRAPALKATNDVVIALTHIGFTANPASVEVDENVDTNLAAQTTGIDAIIGSHSHTNPTSPDAPYKFLPTYVGAQDNTPVIINQAYRYNTFLGEVVLGLLPKAGGGYDVVARAGRDIANATSIPEDPVVKAIVQPYDTFLTTYKTRVVGQTTLPIDTLNSYTTESNGADLQVDASLWKLNHSLPITIDFHLSGAMTNAKIALSASVTNPYTLTVNDMFSLMPYENSLVAFQLNGPQLKTILERAYRNYWYYKYVPGYGGYSYYPTCNLDISAGGIITYTDDPITYTTSISHVVGLSFGNTVVDFNNATKYYNVSTVNYVAAGSCNFNTGGVTIWPLNQITYDTQNYVRDVVIEYLPTLASPITPVADNRIRMIPAP